MGKKTILIFLGAFSLFFFLHGFQKQQQLIPPERHVVEVRLVLVDVIVTKDGKFVTDLSKDDFRLYEDGKEVPIYSFELVSFEEIGIEVKDEKEKTTSPHRPKKRLAVIFDSINSWTRDIKLGSMEIAEQLVELVKLGNEVMVLQMSKNKGMEVLQPFTTDDALINDAVKRASGTLWEAGYQLNGITEVDKNLGEDEEEIGGALKEYISAQQIIDYRFIQKEKFEKTVGGILAACNMLKRFPGRKSVLLISAGIPDLVSLNLGTMNPIRPGQFKQSSKATLDAIHAGGRDQGKMRIFDPFNLLKKKNFRNGDDVIKELTRFANSQNISIYSFAPQDITRSLFTGASAEYRFREDMQHLLYKSHEALLQLQHLEFISKKTGAVSLKGAKKIERFQQIMRTDLNHYYQLSYKPRRSKADDEYHTIKVKVNRRGVDLRFRKGYTDYSEEEERNILLVAAFYTPELYKELPFEAEFIPFYTDVGKYEPWMNIALPTTEIFLDRFIEYGPRRFNLHVWVKDKRSGEKGYGGQINIPINIDSSFKDHMRTIDNLILHFKGPELSFRRKDYQVIFALIDPKTNEIGTWESYLIFPDYKKNKEGSIINCVLGAVYENPEKKKDSFYINKRDGSLEYGQIKFYPEVINRFFQQEGAHVFMQVYLPQGDKGVQPEFSIQGEDGISHHIEGKLKAESWNRKSKIWNSLFFLNISPAAIGDNVLRVEIPGVGKNMNLAKEAKLTIISGGYTQDLARDTNSSAGPSVVP